MIWQQRFDLSPQRVRNSPAVVLRYGSHARAHATTRLSWKNFSRRIVGNGPTWSRWNYQPIGIGSKAQNDRRKRDEHLDSARNHRRPPRSPLALNKSSTVDSVARSAPAGISTRMSPRCAIAASDERGDSLLRITRVSSAGLSRPRAMPRRFKPLDARPPQQTVGRVVPAFAKLLGPLSAGSPCRDPRRPLGCSRHAPQRATRRQCSLLREPDTELPLSPRCAGWCSSLSHTLPSPKWCIAMARPSPSMPAASSGADHRLPTTSGNNAARVRFARRRLCRFARAQGIGPCQRLYSLLVVGSSFNVSYKYSQASSSVEYSANVRVIPRS